jgi:hypothetical protein
MAANALSGTSAKVVAANKALINFLRWIMLISFLGHSFKFT